MNTTPQPVQSVEVRASACPAASESADVEIGDASSSRSQSSARPSSPAWLHGGAAVVDAEGRILNTNDALASWLGASPGEIHGQSLAVLLGQCHAGWTAPVSEFLSRTALFDRLELTARTSSGIEHLSVELCCHGGVRFVRMESELPPVNDLEDAIPEALWSKMAANKFFHRLLRAETQLQNLFERWPGIIFSQRADFSFISVSPKIEELTGLSPADWQRRSNFFWQVVHESDAEPLTARLTNMTDSADGLTSTYRIRHVQTGRVTYLWEHRQAVRSSNGLLLGYEGIWLDITRQTIAERRLLAMSWKENLGTLTMGLAHDFCNIMTGIVSLSETFGSDNGVDESTRMGLNLIRSTAGQANDLARRIRHLHQGRPGEKNYHNLNEVVTNIATVLQKVLSRRLRIQLALDKEQLPVYADAVELQQVIVNLALNAADAMPNGGTLTFRTARHSSGTVLPACVGSEGKTGGTHCSTTHCSTATHGKMPRAPLISVSIQDTGAGIPTSVMDSIFDPFFTTKPLGKGSGLGLYNARLFAENHGAAISVESREQAGTTFHVWFAQADFSEAQQVHSSSHPKRHTMLVAGQPAETRDRIVELLRLNNFYVVPAASAREAFDALHSPAFSFSGALLLSPRAQADELFIFRRIRDEKLPIKTFLSVPGCSQDDIDTTFLEHVDATLPQELPPAEFLSRLRTFLDRT